MPPKKPSPAAPAVVPADLAVHQAEQDRKDAPKIAALSADALTPPCVVCGWPVLPGATCTVDGTVSK